MDVIEYVELSLVMFVMTQAHLIVHYFLVTMESWMKVKNVMMVHQTHLMVVTTHVVLLMASHVQTQVHHHVRHYVAMGNYLELKSVMMVILWKETDVQQIVELRLVLYVTQRVQVTVVLTHAVMDFLQLKRNVMTITTLVVMVVQTNVPLNLVGHVTLRVQLCVLKPVEMVHFKVLQNSVTMEIT